jgi:hypothetical protein
LQVLPELLPPSSLLRLEPGSSTTMAAIMRAA